MAKYIPWGKSVSINLYSCNLKSISSPIAIKKYIRAIVKIVDMVAHGPIYIDRFGIGELEGYSAMQFIETSSITVHCDEPGRRCFIDIFSCKDFDAQKAEQFSKKFFAASKSQATILKR